VINFSNDPLDAPEFKYTDRHVREDVDLRAFAEAYTSAYGGSFEPMLNAKRELRALGRLETRTARVVLNCARYDQNLSGQLPDPKPPTLELVKPVNSKRVPFCNDPRPHDYHAEWRGKKREVCEGIPWEINRHYFFTDVHVRVEFSAAQQSNIYHRNTGKGSRIWYPPLHTMGPAEIGRLNIELVCKYPGRLATPLLFAEEPITLLSSIKKKPGFRTRCPNGCFEE
jgi:hypothetical protein